MQPKYAFRIAVFCVSIFTNHYSMWRKECAGQQLPIADHWSANNSLLPMRMMLVNVNVNQCWWFDLVATTFQFDMVQRLTQLLPVLARVAGWWLFQEPTPIAAGCRCFCSGLGERDYSAGACRLPEKQNQQMTIWSWPQSHNSLGSSDIFRFKKWIFRYFRYEDCLSQISCLIRHAFVQHAT